MTRRSYITKSSTFSPQNDKHMMYYFSVRGLVQYLKLPEKK